MMRLYFRVIRVILAMLFVVVFKVKRSFEFLIQDIIEEFLTGLVQTTQSWSGI